jgi:hypothetical protein
MLNCSTFAEIHPDLTKKHSIFLFMPLQELSASVGRAFSLKEILVSYQAAMGIFQKRLRFS